MKRKGCPLLVQSDTSASLTVQGQSYTRTYFLECLGEKCAAYRWQGEFCEKFQGTVSLKEKVREGESNV